MSYSVIQSNFGEGNQVNSLKISNDGVFDGFISACKKGLANRKLKDVKGDCVLPIPVKLLNKDAKMPTKNNPSDAGWDLYSMEDKVIAAGNREVISTGVSFELFDNQAGLIWPRSGMSVKQGIDVLAGVIDSGYRGEIKVCLFNTSTEAVVIGKGDKIAQMVIQPVVTNSLREVEELSSSDRGENGFGSSGK